MGELTECEPWVAGAHDQDRAAGGRAARVMEIDGRPVLTWVVLRAVRRARRSLSASLGWRGRDGGLRERPVAELDDAQPFEAALRCAWTRVHAHRWP